MDIMLDLKRLITIKEFKMENLHKQRLMMILKKKKISSIMLRLKT
jgi:hypothetical protein